VTASRLGLRFRALLLRLTSSRVPIWSPCQYDFSRSFVSSTTGFLYIFPEIQGALLLCQDLKVPSPFPDGEQVFRTLSGSLTCLKKQGSCSADPCGALYNRWSLLLQTSLEFLFECPVKERSSLFRIYKKVCSQSFVRLHYNWDVALYPRGQTRSRRINPLSFIPLARCIAPEGWGMFSCLLHQICCVLCRV
jgi:hypothetical protein